MSTFFGKHDEFVYLASLPRGRISHLAYREAHRLRNGWETRIVKTLCGRTFMGNEHVASLGSCARCHERARRSTPGQKP